MKPRNYQKKLIQAAWLSIDEGRRPLVVSPPASGKTVIMAQIAKRAVHAKRPVLILGHLRTIIPQAWKHCSLANIPESKLSLLMANTPEESFAPFREDALVTVASIQTLDARVLKSKKKWFPAPDLIIVDEAHHIVSNTYLKLLRRFPKAQVIGLTAFSRRLDGKGLGDVFDEIVEGPTANQLIEQGVLSRPRIFQAPDEYLPDLQEIKIQMGDYNLEELNKAMDRNVLIGNVVEHYAEKGLGRPNVTFAVTIQHSRNLVARYRAAGITAEHLDGSQSPQKREAVLRRLRKKETRVVCTCMTLSEGWDEPAVRVVSLARPTRSEALYLNQVGRGLRYYGGIRPIILDHSRNTLLHGRPDDDREHSLDDRKPKRRTKRGDEPKAQVCPMCRAINDLGAEECEECGTPLHRSSEDPSEIDAELIEVTRELWDNRRKKLADFAKSKGWKPKEVKDWTGRVMNRWMGPRP